MEDHLGNGEGTAVGARNSRYDSWLYCWVIMTSVYKKQQKYLDWRTKLKNYIFSLIGKVWYEWGGQDPDSGKADCSGLVIAAIKKVGVWPREWPPDMTAQGLRDRCKPVRGAKPGDLCFYGKNGKVTHVMIFMGEVQCLPHCVAGMTGGGRNQKVKYSQLVGAGCWLRTTPYYRRDFLGYGRLPNA